MLQFFKNLFSWIFTKKNKSKKAESVNFVQPFVESKEEPITLPQIEKKKIIIPKQTESDSLSIYKASIAKGIPPDYSTMPKSYSFKNRKTQMVVWWDCLTYPYRWRTKLIHH